MYLYFSVYLLNQVPPHPKGAAGMECRPEMLSFFILYYLCLRVHHNIFPPLLPSLYEPSWDFARLHIQHDELPKGRGANIVAEPIYHVKIFKNQKINSNMTPYSF